MSLQLRSSRSVILASLLLGVSADRLFVGRWFGVSAPLFVGGGLLALAWLSAAERRPPTRANLWLGALALVFAGFVAVRDAPTLVFLNVVATLGLLLLLAASYRGPRVLTANVPQLVVTTLLASWRIGTAAPGPIRHALRGAAPRRTHLAGALPVVRGLLLAFPVLVVFGALLMSADSVFSSYVTQLLSFDIPFDIGSFVGHSLFALFVAWLCAGGLVAALQGQARRAAVLELPAEGDTQRLYLEYLPPRMLGAIEAITVLGLVDVLFGAFMLIQGAYFFGGLDTLERTGMTYADYARRGFFELLAVACLALGLLGLLAIITRRQEQPQRRAFNTTSGLVVLLVLGMLGSAFSRMALYEQAYGFTQLRLYTHTFMVWLALVLLLYLLALLRNRAEIFVVGTALAALGYLGALNVASPDAIIARANVARLHAGGKLDPEYLTELSADATPTLVTALPTLPPADQAVLRERLDDQRRTLERADAEQGWPAWNVGRARAIAALEALP